MSRRGTFIGVCVSLAVVLVIGLLIYGLGSRPAPRPPELGGQKVPDRVFDIRFDRRYDLFCSLYGQEPMVFRNCTILGFTGRGEESGGTGRGLGIGVLSVASGSGSSYAGRYFEHWLVLKLADGRLAYVPPDAVRCIEEASGKDE